jgi:hypothetical protein
LRWKFVETDRLDGIAMGISTNAFIIVIAMHLKIWVYIFLMCGGYHPPTI